MRRFLPVLVLVLLAPLVAELLAGSTPLSQPSILAFLLPVYLPLYGAGAVLIRELVRRSGRGWASILLLGAAYGSMEEGFASQSLFNPTLYHAAEWGGRVLGINGVFTEWVIVVHAIWSAAIPILLTELLFPERRTTPYLGRLGLVVTSICYLLGIALLWLIARASYAAGYEAPPLLPGLAVLVAVVLAVVALGVLPRKAPQPKLHVYTPHPGVVFLVISISGFMWQASLYLWGIQPVFSDWPLVLIPVLGALSIAASVTRLVIRWSRGHTWNDLHLLALASGAVICHTLIGVLAITQTLADRMDLIVLGLLMSGGLAWFAFHIHRRVLSQDHLVNNVTAGLLDRPSCQ